MSGLWCVCGGCGVCVCACVRACVRVTTACESSDNYLKIQMLHQKYISVMKINHILQMCSLCNKY